MTDYTFGPEWFQNDDEDDVMPFSLTALREIFRHTPLADLPAEFAACLAGDTRAIAANHVAHRKWEVEEARKKNHEQTRNTQAAAVSATPDPSQMAIVSALPIQPTTDAPRPSSQGHPIKGANQPANSRATVHRTDIAMARGKRSYTDAALQVCPQHFYRNLGQNQARWEPRDLFPEISTPSPREVTQTVPSVTRQSEDVPVSFKAPLPDRTNRSRVNKKKSGADGIIDLDTQAFVEIPLQLAEGKELLALIGAGGISIPSHIMNSCSQQQQPTLEVGQSSKGPKRNRKQKGPVLHPQVGPVQRTDTVRENDCLMDNGPVHRADPTPQQLAITQTTALMGVSGSSASENLEDDPYIDQVDYSDEDVTPAA